MMLKDYICEWTYDPQRHMVARSDEPDTWREVEYLARELLNLVGSPRTVREAIQHIEHYQALRLRLPAPGIFLDSTGAAFGGDPPALGLHERYTRLAVPIQFAVDQEPPPWSRLFAGMDDAAAETARIWILGALLGIPTNKVLYVWGPGGAGKSRLGETLLQIFGDMAEAVSDAERILRHDEYYVASLQGKRLLALTEFTKQILGSGLKSLSGSDRLTGRWPYGRPFTFVPTHRILIISNEPPIHTDIPSAMQRRLLILKMTPPRESDPGLQAQLTETSGAWISWLWAKYGDLADLIETREIMQTQDATAYDMSADSVTNFAQEKLATPCGLATAYSSYREYCDGVLGAKALSRDIFKSRLRALGYPVERDISKCVTIYSPHQGATL